MSLFIRLPIALNNPTLPKIDPKDIEDFSKFESRSYGHWIFDTGNDEGFTAPLTNKVLSKQGADPEFSASHLTLPLANGDALVTDYLDKADAVDTVSFVFKLDAFSGVQVLNGTLSSADGGGLFISSGNLWQNYRGAVTSQEVKPSLQTDTWYFVAIARDFSGAQNDLRILVGGENVYTAPHSGAYSVPTGPVTNLAFGNANYAASTTSKIDLLGANLVDHAMTNEEMAALYSRRKTYFANKGIPVV